MSLIARAISWIDHKNIIIQIYIYLDYFALLLAAAARARARIGCWLLLDKFGAINLVRNKLFPLWISVYCALGLLRCVAWWNL